MIESARIETLGDLQRNKQPIYAYCRNRDCPDGAVEKVKKLKLSELIDRLGPDTPIQAVKVRCATCDRLGKTFIGSPD